MSKIKNIIYLIEYKNGYSDEMNKEVLEESVDDIFNDVHSIIKRYRLENETKKTYYRITLFSCDHEFTSEEYIEHYRSMPKHIYGVNFLDDFDIEIIQKFNY